MDERQKLILRSAANGMLLGYGFAACISVLTGTSGILIGGFFTAVVAFMAPKEGRGDD